jgi:hypothetical protein
MSLSNAFYIAAGEENEIYAVAAPRVRGDDTLYRWNGTAWVVLGDKAGEEMAVGVKGKLFITSDRPSNNRVFESHAYNKDW